MIVTLQDDLRYTMQITLSAGLYDLTADLLRFIVPPNGESKVYEMLSQQAGHLKKAASFTNLQPTKVSLPSSLCPSVFAEFAIWYSFMFLSKLVLNKWDENALVHYSAMTSLTLTAFPL